jgi:hypothetical protein
MKMVNIMRDLDRAADRVIRSILQELPDLRVESKWDHSGADQGYDLAIDASSNRARFRFGIRVRSRVTPQTALSLSQLFPPLPKGTIPVIFAPTISPRVAQILREQDIGYADQAGNCWLRSAQHHLLIERQGFPSERQPTPAAANPFSTKSSRIVRAMLTSPMEGWPVRKLAEHPDVQVSPGLVVKVKRALVEQGYAVERQRLLYLRDPIDLLNAWSEEFPGPVEAIPFYFRGGVTAGEQTISRWCQDHALQYALAGSSAAWRLAPAVRYTVAAVYLEDGGFDQTLLDELESQYAVKRVDTGPNLYLWRAFDRSVYAGKGNAGHPEQPVTPPLQTYLDLKRTAGRGEVAANAIFKKYLSGEFEAVTRREEERQGGRI